ncbi:MAG: ABC transporter ATP-binding protein [Oscillospiraceae bacterium]|nr:ABC transporter ATP-binding protein [Oscillospiraceae bacterium]
MTLCDIRGLSKTYPEFKLDNLSFTLSAGRITGFIGRNGAGKTTTIKSILGLVHPDCGEISYFGLPFGKNEQAIKQRIGYSTGAVNYYPKKKIKDIVAVTKTFYDTWDEAAYQEYLELFSLNENKMPCELSEGMKVKFNLLLALSHKAEILILDEPTSGLDPFSRDELLDLFTELKNRGVAILFSTHITSDLEKCADDILYIKNGRLVASCSKDEFGAQYGEAGETLEETILRMERSKDV